MQIHSMNAGCGARRDLRAGGLRLLSMLLLSGLVLVGRLEAREPLTPRRQVPRVFKSTTTVRHELRYLQYLPPGYSRDRDQRFPLVLFLHGAGERGTNLNLVATHGPPRLVREGREFPFILISPQCPAEERWQPDVLVRLLDKLGRELRVDQRRVYVTGLSMGGFGSWALAARYPERFAAVAPICGGGEWIDVRLAGRRQEALKGLGIWAFHGAKDTVVPLSESERMVSVYRQMGVADLRLSVDPEAGHDSWTKAYEGAALYDWLVSHHR